MQIYYTFIVSGLLLLVLALFIFMYKLKQNLVVKQIEYERKCHELSVKIKEHKSTQEEQSNIKNHLRNELKRKEDNLINFALNILQKNAFLDELKAEINEIKPQVNDQKLLAGLNNLTLKINHQIALDKDRKTFNLQLEESSKNFHKRLEELYPNLTIKEKRLATYLRLKLNSKEIASLLNINIKSVEMNRYRLRKKLKINSKENLVEFILGI